MDENKRRPETAISVEELPDFVLQPEFREVLDEQFKVSYIIVYMYMHIMYLSLIVP